MADEEKTVDTAVLTEESGPCPPVEGDADNTLATKSDADFDAEEKDEVA